jgi:hypothetical protein
MSEENQAVGQLQSQFADEFLYFFLGLRKDRVRRTVQRMRDQHPDESKEQLARRLISSKSQLSVIGGTLTHLAMLIPGVGQALQLLGFVCGTSMMTRMHLYLILEIALLYEKDIDDKARIPEIAAVVGAVGLGTAAPFLVRILDVNPLYALPAAAMSAATVTQLVGESAIRVHKSEEYIASEEAFTYPERGSSAVV